MHHLVMPRLAARAQFRRQVQKLRYWRTGEASVADLRCDNIPGERLYELRVEEGYGLAAGFRIVFCDGPNPEPYGTICVLAVLRADEPLTPITRIILRGREQVARERLVGGTDPRPEYDDDHDPSI